MERGVTLLIILGLFSCAPMGQVKTYKSQVDGKGYAQMQLVNVSGKNRILVGLLSTDSTVILEAGTYGITRILEGSSFRAVVDGKKFTPQPIDVLTQHRKNWAGLHVSTRRYSISNEFLNGLAHGKEVWLRIDTADGFIEEQMDDSGPNSAHDKIQEFIYAKKHL